MGISKEHAFNILQSEHIPTYPFDTTDWYNYYLPSLVHLNDQLYPQSWEISSIGQYFFQK